MQVLPPKNNKIAITTWGVIKIAINDSLYDTSASRSEVAHADLLTIQLIIPHLQICSTTKPTEKLGYFFSQK